MSIVDVVATGTRVALATAALQRGDQSIATALQHTLDVVCWPAHATPPDWHHALETVRSDQHQATRLVVSAPGDPGGFRGDRQVIAAAVAAGSAMVIDAHEPAWALIPTSRPDHLEWAVHPIVVSTASTDAVPQARGRLRTQLVESSELLEELEVARSNPAVTVETKNALARCDFRLLRDLLTADALDLLETSIRVLVAVEVATRDDAGATSSGAASQRRHAIAPIAGAARRALEAAYSSPRGTAKSTSRA